MSVERISIVIVPEVVGIAKARYYCRLGIGVSAIWVNTIIPVPLKPCNLLPIVP